LAVFFAGVFFAVLDFFAALVFVAGVDFLAVLVLAALVFLAGVDFAVLAFLAVVDFAAVDFEAVLLVADFLAVVAFAVLVFFAGVDFAALFFAVLVFLAGAAFFAAAAAEAAVVVAFFAAALDAVSVSFGSFLAPDTTFFRSAPGLNFGTAVFLALIRSPVCGLRTHRAWRTRFSNDPNPVMATFSPRATSRVIVSSTESSACAAAFRFPS